MLRDQILGAGALTGFVTGNTDRVSTRLQNGKRTRSIRARFRATVTVTVAPTTAVRNRGSVLALFSQVGISEGGVDIVNLDGRSLRFLSDMESPSAMTSVRAATPVAVYNLEETVIIPFGSSLQAAPWETSFAERDVQQRLEFFVVPNIAIGQIYTVGGATVVFSAISVTVQQLCDNQRDQPALFRPYMRTIATVPIVATVADFLIDLPSSRFTRGYIIQQDTVVGEVADIITSLRMLGDFREYIGPGPVAFDDLAYGTETELGGAASAGGVSGDTAGYLFLNFIRSGRLSNILNPAVDVNQRLMVNAAVSASGASTIRVSALELERIPGLTAADPLPFEV